MNSLLRTTLLLAALFAVIAPPTRGDVDTPKVEIRNVRKIFDNGHHNAFTDMTVFKDALYLAFRSCPDGHGVSPNASIIIMTSKDAKEWKQVHSFNVPKRDTRDPHFLVFKKQLFVYTGTWYSGDAPAKNNKDLELNQHLGFAVVSADGVSWSEPKLLDGTFGHYVWRAASLGEKAYLCGRRKIGFAVGPKGEPNEIESLMLESDDGFIWRKRAVFQEIAGDETAFLFERGGKILGIGRRRGNAQLLRSEPPYAKWTRTDLDRHIGGPLLAKWGGRTIVGGRHSTVGGPKTSMCWLVGEELHEFAELPSGGDNSYPGFVAISPSEAVMSWYSSHEGKSSIYMADLSIPADKKGFDSKQERVLLLGDSILSSQRSNGGFSKGNKFNPPIARAELLKNCFERDLGDTTFDNGATHRQIRELARAYAKTKVPRLRHGCEAGLEFMLEAQYANGGWPQRFPDPSNYAKHITFNDNAMVGVLTVLHEVAVGVEPFQWVDENLRKRAEEAVARAIDCILKCQITVGGQLTAWGQQHDEVTLEPRPARAFEPAALCSSESVKVVEFLMDIKDPSPEVMRSIEAAVAWLDGPAKLVGIRQENSNTGGKIVVKDANSPPLWARLYEIGTNRPVFGDRDSKVYHELSKISAERRNGYSWYVSSPRQLIEKAYPVWRKRVAVEGPLIGG